MCDLRFIAKPHYAPLTTAGHFRDRRHQIGKGRRRPTIHFCTLTVMTGKAQRRQHNGGRQRNDHDAGYGVNHHKTTLIRSCLQGPIPLRSDLILAQGFCGLNKLVYAIRMSEGGSLRVKYGQKALGLGLAIGLHLCLLYVFAISSSKGLPIEGLDGDEGDIMQGAEIAMDVSLVEATHSMIRQNTPDTSLTFEKFMKMSEAVPDEAREALSIAPPKALSLAQALGEEAFTPKGAANATAQTTDAATSMVDVKGRNRKTPNDLWKAIEPCWRRIVDNDTLPVTLEVTFSPLGNLAKPPVIKRDPAATLTDKVLRSESQAITALSQCGPYLMAYGQSGVNIGFPAMTR